MAAEFEQAPHDPTESMRDPWVTVISRFARSSSGIAETQGEPIVQLDAMADDLTRGPVEGHRRSTSDLTLIRPLSNGPNPGKMP